MAGTGPRITLARRNGDTIAQACAVRSLDGSKRLYWQTHVSVRGVWRSERLSAKKSNMEVIDHMTSVYESVPGTEDPECPSAREVAQVLARNLYGIEEDDANDNLPAISTPVNISFGALSVR